MIHFAYTILYVDDVRKSTSFYEAAFGLQRKFVAPGGDYAELSTGSTTLAFAVHALAASNLKSGYVRSRPDNQPFGMEIGFTTDDVAATMQAAEEAGATATELPVTKPWGQVVAYVRDPDGILIELCTPMG